MISWRLIVSSGELEAGVWHLTWSLPLEVEVKSGFGGDSRLFLFAGVLPSFAVEARGVGTPRLLL